MLEVLLSVGDYPLEFAFCTFLAAIPTLVWFGIFGFRHRKRWSHILLTFVAGMFSAAMILTYQYFWGEQFNLIFFSLEPQNFDSAIRSQVSGIFLSSFLVMLSVGFLEEYAKHWVVKKTDERIFETIDDVIEFSIIAALGFAFLENIGYFMRMLLGNQPDNLIELFVVRSVFVVFVHVLCSGIYGYFYGLGYFATPVIREREEQGKLPWIPHTLHRIAHFKKETVFREEMATVGLILAMGIHGLYDFLLDIGTVGNLMTMVTGRQSTFSGSDLQIHLILLPAMLVLGFSYLSHLLDKKEMQKRYGHLEIREVYVTDEKTHRSLFGQS